LDASVCPCLSILLLTWWRDTSDDDKVFGPVKNTLEMIRSQALEKGTALDFVYLNYSFNCQDLIGSYGAENKRRLQEVSKKYDPEGVFQKAIPGGFKLF
jgi:hypothetical protein